MCLPKGRPEHGSPRTTGWLTRGRLFHRVSRPRAISRWESLLSQLLQRRVHHAMEAAHHKTHDADQRLRGLVIFLDADADDADSSRPRPG